MEDISRYERQYGYIKKVCQVYETRPESFAELLELMHEVSSTFVWNCPYDEHIACADSRAQSAVTPELASALPLHQFLLTLLM